MLWKRDFLFCSVLFCQTIKITKYVTVLHYSHLYFSRLLVRALWHIFILPSLMCLWKQLQKCFRFLVLVDLFFPPGNVHLFLQWLLLLCSWSGILEACNKLCEEYWWSFCSLVVSISGHVLVSNVAYIFSSFLHRTYHLFPVQLCLFSEEPIPCCRMQ